MDNEERFALADRITQLERKLAEALLDAERAREERNRVGVEIRREWMAKCEELRKDAERYQFLKVNAFRGEPDMGGNHHWMGIGRKIGRGGTLNDAIDAAMAKKEGA